uniref:Uncharacterized protein n=1 Tax=Podoviridae sp. ctXBg1 TaxID=2827739 RepID=A0A8S5SQY6_9CAUD|nr:MAG TPA: hypothetical protein [Podoviridae sp. ctXBg1]
MLDVKFVVMVFTPFNDWKKKVANIDNETINKVAINCNSN